MSHLKRSASHYNKAVTRLAALKSIDPGLDLGNGMTISGYEAALNDLRSKLDGYNTSLSTVDDKNNLWKASEKTLRDLSERMLTGVATRFGKNSSEYEMAGGARKSDVVKKRSKSKKEAA